MKLYRRHIASGAFDNAADYPGGEPFEAGTGFEWVEGAPAEDAQVYRPQPLDERVAAAFGQLDIQHQIKFRNEIRDAAFFFEKGNLPMVAVVIGVTESNLSLPDDQPVKDIIDAAKAELGG